MNVMLRMSERRKRTTAAVGIAAVVLVSARMLLAPAWREAAALRVRLEQLSAEHARLATNLSLRGAVDAEFTQLPLEAFERSSEHLTLSTWLRQLEASARRPGMLIGNMKAQPVKRERQTSIYTVRLAVSGRLQEVLQFIAEATEGGAVTGIDAFTLRGVQGTNTVECGLTLRMVCIPSSSATTPSKSPAPAPVGRSGA